MHEHIPEIIGRELELIILLWLGASARAGTNYLSAKKRRLSYRIADYVVTLIVGAFTGIIFGMASSLAGQSELAIGISVGLGAWLGIEGLNAIASMILTTIIKDRKDD